MNAQQILTFKLTALQFAKEVHNFEDGVDGFLADAEAIFEWLLVDEDPAEVTEPVTETA